MSAEPFTSRQATVDALQRARGPKPGSFRDPAQVPVSEIMTSPVKFARVGTSVTALVDLFLRDGISAVPVLDENGTPMGVVSKTDLLERYYQESETREEYTRTRRKPRDSELELEFERGFHLEHLEAVTVEEVMTPLIFGVNEQASISRAAALMAYENIHRVGVMNKNGKAVGIVSALDIMCWLARESGYGPAAGARSR